VTDRDTSLVESSNLFSAETADFTPNEDIFSQSAPDSLLSQNPETFIPVENNVQPQDEVVEFTEQITIINPSTPSNLEANLGKRDITNEISSGSDLVSSETLQISQFDLTYEETNLHSLDVGEEAVLGDVEEEDDIFDILGEEEDADVDISVDAVVLQPEEEKKRQQLEISESDEEPRDSEIQYPLQESCDIVVDSLKDDLTETPRSIKRKFPDEVEEDSPMLKRSRIESAYEELPISYSPDAMIIFANDEIEELVDNDLDLGIALSTF